MGLEIGHVIDGKYTIRRLIGSGGMGRVYEGEHALIRRRVAIKVLNTKLASEAGFVRRFEREAQAAGRIGSAHIVEVLDLGTLDNGDRYMVMEYLDGESLRQRMDREGAMPPAEIFPIIISLLDGLAAAHHAGILHRDLKPANVFLSDDSRQQDFVKILDFGVSKFAELDAEDGTATGVMLGTPKYMSPEQAKGDKSIDARADIYAVGVILYRALTGRAPFEADTYNELLFKVVLEDPPSLSSILDDADPAVVALVAKAMARERDERFGSAEEMAEALRGWLLEHGHAAPAPPSKRAASPYAREAAPVSNREPTGSTKMTSSTLNYSRATPRWRSWRSWLVLATLGVLCFDVVVFLQLRSRAEKSEGDAPAVTPEGSADDDRGVEPPAAPDDAHTSEGPATASAAPKAIAEPAASSVPTTRVPDRTLPRATTQPATPAHSGPARKYRRDL